MTTLEIEVGELRPVAVTTADGELIVRLADGRTIATPLAWYPKLVSASAKALANVELMPMGMHWPELDEDLSIAGMLAGAKATDKRSRS
jgi:hypothetical protein